MFAQPTRKHGNWLVSAAMVMTLVGLFITLMAKAASASDILWHNSSTGETQIWLLDGARVAGRETVLGETGSPAFVDLPWSIVAISFGNFEFGDPRIIWHNSATNETQWWGMINQEVKGRATVLGEDGKPAFVGPPWSIVGAGDFYGDGSDEIVWHNSATGETQLWLMDDSTVPYRVTGRATVLGEDGKPAFVGLPWSIVGAGYFKGDNDEDLVWHNSATGETQLWLMNGYKVTGRRTVLGEDGKPAFVGSPWSIVGAGSFTTDGKPGLAWHNSATGESQLWLMDGYKVTGRATVLGEDGKPALVGLPWSIVGIAHFSRDGVLPVPPVVPPATTTPVTPPTPAPPAPAIVVSGQRLPGGGLIGIVGHNFTSNGRVDIFLDMPGGTLSVGYLSAASDGGFAVQVRVAGCVTPAGSVTVRAVDAKAGTSAKGVLNGLDCQ